MKTKFFILFIFPLFVFGQSHEPKFNAKAVALNKKAFKLYWSGNSNDKALNLKIVKTLDSATFIDPKFNAAYFNKLKALLALKKYDLALTALNNVIKNDPKNITAYIDEAVIYECYLKDGKRADVSYKKAYNLALQNVKNDGHKNSYYDQAVAYVLFYYKGKESSIAYLNKVLPYYKDEKSIKQVNDLKASVIREENNTENKKKVFDKTF